MKPPVAAALVLALAAPAAAADGPALLFAQGAGKLTPTQQREVFAALELKVAPDGKGFVDPVCGERAGAQVELRDMNGDGKDDLVIGGPGFCFPVWRWNGKAYEFHRNEPQAPGGCDEVGR